MNPNDRYADIVAALGRLGLSPSAATYHGLLCGALCVQEPEQVDPLRLIEGEQPSATDSNAVDTLNGLRDSTHQSLADMQTGFMPLLPQDESALGLRTVALSEWCEGFLYGLAGRRKLNLKSCSEEVREVIKDFTEFTRATLQDSDDLETEEGAYTELVEYIRVGAQLVFMELRPARIETAGRHTLH